MRNSNRVLSAAGLIFAAIGISELVADCIALRTFTACVAMRAEQRFQIAIAENFWSQLGIGERLEDHTRTNVYGPGGSCCETRNVFSRWRRSACRARERYRFNGI